MNPDFWRGKRVFLTGHTGFKGGWLALWLHALGAEVTGYAREAPPGLSLYEAAGVGDAMQASVIADIRDPERLREAMARARPDIVLHLAAQALVRPSYDKPVDTYAANVMGTVYLLEAVRSTPTVRAVVCVTSDKCYENREWPWGYRENEAMGGYDPYSSSKGCAELVTAAYRNSFFHPERFGEHRVAVATARAGNVIGGGDWAQDRLIPDFIRAISAGQPLSIRNPAAVRPWQHVLEPLAGYLLLAEKLYRHGPEFASAWNFGPCEDDARTVEWIAAEMTRIWGEGSGYRVQHDDAAVHEAHYLKLDCSKARQRLGWRPRWALPDALRRICDWHRGHRAGADMRAVCLEQIADFQLAATD
ncbi:CDP-glucose 4,6-dehydratase [Chromobacterium sp. ATCC 53434]|uniref:CDP-glucose 4,6-dehydratase n=1 Tax=Chromobacterium TaxID=535 RepID=UPI000C786FA1|nr:CDP-glucose 4,6-dehydratase [Chromobacterium sp. ATCC 53434]AUH52556.1 CDP-glucose 4,6-dehydratase [Chromobacterium sp. ATCC 53434]